MQIFNYDAQKRQVLNVLVLTLTENEYIEIGEGIRVFFEKRSDGSLAVAIDAPPDKKILRGKLYEAAHPDKKNTGVPHRRNDRRRRKA